MIRICRFLKKASPQASLPIKPCFSTSIKRFNLGEIPEVLKYDRPYGSAFFFSAILNLINLFRNGNFAQWDPSLFRKLAFPFSNVFLH